MKRKETKRERELRKELDAANLAIKRAQWIAAYRPKVKPSTRLTGEELRQGAVYLERLIKQMNNR